MGLWSEPSSPPGFGSVAVRDAGGEASAVTPAAVVAVPLILICGVAGLVEAAPAIPLAALLLFAAGWLILGGEGEDDADRRQARTLFAWGFVLRVGLGIFLYYWLIHTRGEPFLGGGDDAEYEQMGTELFGLWGQGDYRLPFYMRNNPGYFVFMAMICQVGEWLGGYHTLLPRIVNACVGGLIPAYVFLLVRNLASRPVAVGAGLLAMGYPELVFYSAVQLRDILIVFLFVFAAHQLVRFTARGRASGLAWALAATLLTFYFRAAYGYLLLGGLAACLMASLLFQGGGDRWRRWGKAAILGVAALALYGLLKGSESRGHLVVDEAGTLTRPLESEYVDGQIAQHREIKLAVAGEESLGARFLTRIPFGIGFAVMPVVAFFMPYPPWYALTVPDPLMFLHFVNALAWTLLMPLALLGLREGWRARAVLWPVLVPFALVMIASCSGGFQQRYKLPAMPFALVFAAIGWRMLFREPEKGGGRLYVWVQAGLAAAYFSAKLVTM